MFLTLRTRELRSGSRLLVVVPGVDDEGSTGFESLLDGANAVLHEMVDHGVLTSEERGRMVVPTHPRRRKDLLEPFEKGRFSKQLTVEDSAMSQVADSAWDLYERDGDRDALINKRVPFFRSVFVPSLACALDYTRSQEGKRSRYFRRRTGEASQTPSRKPPGANEFVRTSNTSRKGVSPFPGSRSLVLM